MDEFLKFHEAEQELWKKNLDKHHGLVSIVAESWSSFVTAHYFVNIADGANLVVAYKAQADKALFCALNSVLNQHLGQAAMQLRYATENLNVALAVIYDYQKFERIYEKHGIGSEPAPLNEDIKKAAYKIIEANHPDESAKIKSLKEAVLNLYGSHQSISILGTNFTIDRDASKFKIGLFDSQRHEMYVGILGLIGGLMHHYSPMFVKAVAHDSKYLSINPKAIENIEEQQSRLEAIRAEAAKMLERL